MSILLASALTLTIVPAPGDLPSSHEGREVTIRYDDLDLSKDMGKRSLQRRVRRAIKVACPLTAGTRDLRELVHANACRAKAHGNADKQIALIEEQHRGRTLAARRP
ncbi:UrcA family protein [Qipengyuania spongiae]|uniref:UrcA family protein n=1 Tax=Qipengyuania spongiae TaxID=2909673 RepID=UPI003B975F03